MSGTTDAKTGVGSMGFPADLPALTSVRFVLALGVVFFHYHLQWAWNPETVTGVFERARLGVDVFFILSGFVLTHAYRRAIDAGQLNYPRFIVARLARIYPAHLAVLALVLGMVGTARIVGSEFDTEFYQPAGLLMTLLLIQSWTPNLVVAEWNGPSWSLSAEWFAYLAFPIFAWVGWVLRARPWLLLLLSGVVLLALDRAYMAAFGTTVVHAENNLGILRIIPEFLYGVALYRIGQRLNPSPKAARLAALAASVAVLLLMHFAADDRLVMIAAGPLVLGLALLTKAGAGQALATRWLVASGEASYALYLIHMPVLIGWKGVYSMLTGRASDYVLAWWEVGWLLILTIPAAFLLHYWIEQPARTWIRNLSDRHLPDVRSRAGMTPGSQPPDV